MRQSINLLPPKSKSELSKQLILILFVILLLSLSAIYLWYLQVQQKIGIQERQDTVLQQQLTQVQLQIDELQLNASTDFLESLYFVRSTQYPTSAVIDELYRFKSSVTYILDVNYTDELVTMTVQFETMQEAADYLSKLEESDFFIDANMNSIVTEAVTQQEESDEEKSEGTIDFSDQNRVVAQVELQLNQSHLRELVGDVIEK